MVAQSGKPNSKHQKLTTTTNTISDRGAKKSDSKASHTNKNDGQGHRRFSIDLED